MGFVAASMEKGVRVAKAKGVEPNVRTTHSSFQHCTDDHCNRCEAHSKPDPSTDFTTSC